MPGYKPGSFKLSSSPPFTGDPLNLASGEDEKLMYDRGTALGTVLDFLSRTSRASAAAADNQGMSGVIEALKGKNDTTYKDVLENRGVTGPLASIGGFAGDVLLDPLTYLSVGGTKGKKGLAAFQEVKDEALATGKFGKVVDDLADALAAENPSKMYIKFRGKPIFESKTVGKAIDQTFDKTFRRSTGEGRLGYKMFSQKGELPFGLDEMLRVQETKNAASFHDHQLGIKKVFSALTPDERREIALATDTGRDLKGIVHAGAATDPNGFADLGDYQALARKLNDDIFNDEVALGLMNPKEYNPNYVYRVYTERLGDIVGEGKKKSLKLGGPNTGSFQQARTADITLEQAENLGYKPLTDISDILTTRYAKHYQVATRAQMVDEVVQRFGVPFRKDTKKWLGTNDWVSAADIEHPLAKTLGSQYLPRPVVQAMNATQTVLGDNHTASEFLRFYDRVMGHWKFSVTAINPGFHARNMMSDAILNFSDGVRDPAVYGRSAKIIKEIREGIATDLNRKTYNYSKVRVHDNVLTSRQLWEIYAGSGAKSGYISSDLYNDLGTKTKVGLASSLGRAQEKLLDLSDTREDFTRLAHFISAFKDELPKGKSIYQNGKLTPVAEQAAAKAAKRVRKYNIDYGALSSFERNAVKRVVPFYSWMRHNIPLQVEMLFTKPGVMALYPKSQNLLQGLLGTDENDDTLVPQWMRELAPMRLATQKQEGNTPLSKFLSMMGVDPAGDSVASLATTPIANLSSFSGPMKGDSKATFAELLSQTTPFIKAPAELAAGETLFSGAPIESGGAYAASALPPLGQNIVKTIQGDEVQNKWARWLTGLDVRPITDGNRAGEYYRRLEELNKENIPYVEDPIDAVIARYRQQAQQIGAINPPKKTMDFGRGG